MSHLMAYHDTDGTVIHGVGSVDVEIWRLEYAGGEAYLVHLRTVVGVDGLGRHVPFVAVNRFAQLVVVVLHEPFGGP